jgi:DNA-binding transcriptional LysR family regulator
MTSLRRLLPSAGALFVFEAAARYLSFTRAAAELNVTQSAVSRMVGRLETHLDTKLFLRNATGIELTEDGRQLYHAVTGGFQRVEIALEDIRAKHGDEGTVTLSLSSAFATHWFMPRLGRFQESFPRIDLRFQLVCGEPTGSVEDVDVAVRYNAEEDVDHQRWLLMEEEVLPVCSPAYLAAHGGLDSSADLSGHTLAHLSGSIRIPWSRYLAEFGYPALAGSRSLTFSDYSLVIQAAVSGRGIALGWWHVVSHELLQGMLVPAASKVLRTGRSYSLVATSRRARRKPAALVRDWLLEEMARERAELSAGSMAPPRRRRVHASP